MRLYSYSLRIDDGAAPNPYGGVCTLAICKPMIRKHAQEGDWVVGLGSTNAPMGKGDLSNHIVYAMKITTDPMTFHQYDQHCRVHLPIKIPGRGADVGYEAIVGDCIYYKRGKKYRQRSGVHYQENMATDLSGEYVLLSENFYYFGEHAIELPAQFSCIRHPNQGHKVKKNEGIKTEFVTWIESCDQHPINKILGLPLDRQRIMDWHNDRSAASDCAIARADDDERDPSTIC